MGLHAVVEGFDSADLLTMSMDSTVDIEASMGGKLDGAFTGGVVRELTVKETPRRGTAPQMSLVLLGLHPCRGQDTSSADRLLLNKLAPRSIIFTGRLAAQADSGRDTSAYVAASQVEKCGTKEEHKRRRDGP